MALEWRRAARYAKEARGWLGRVGRQFEAPLAHRLPSWPVARKEPDMFRRILVPLDGSRLAEGALDPAFDLARKFGGELVFLRVVPTEELELLASQYTVSRLWEQQECQAARTYLQALSAAWDSQGLPVRLEVQVGAVPSTIVATVSRLAVSLIVMSTHGRSGLSRLIYGSVAEAVVRAAKVPVLFVPNRARTLHPDEAAAGLV